LHPFPWYTFSINNRQELVGGKVNKMKKRIAAIVLCALLVVCVFPTATFAAQNNEDIIILYENDVHCAVEGWYSCDFNANTDGYTFAQLTKDVRGKKCLIQKIKDIFAKIK
jgi:hypothetical protein